MVVRHRVHCAALAAALVLATWPSPSSALSLDDPKKDDRGPGGYTYPSGSFYTRGVFDLVRFEAVAQGDEVLFTVTFDAPLVRPTDLRRGDGSAIALENGIYLQNVDIYMDTEPGRGFTEALPGRNVRFLPAEGWDVAVVLAPLPYDLRSALDGWKPGMKVIVPADVRSRGTRVYARVPAHLLGGPPAAHWGWQVLVSGAAWSLSFDAVSRVLGEHRPNAYTMKVNAISEQDAFGGGELSIYQPAVIDALAPPGRSQFAFLSGWDAAAERLAVVPMVYPDALARQKVEDRARLASPPPPLVVPQAPPTSTVAAGGALVVRVRSIDGELVVLEKPSKPIPRFAMGAVLDLEGQVSGRVVLTAEYPDFLLAQVVQGKDRIVPGAQVRFEKPKE